MDLSDLIKYFNQNLDNQDKTIKEGTALAGARVDEILHPENQYGPPTPMNLPADQAMADYSLGNAMIGSTKMPGLTPKEIAAKNSVNLAERLGVNQNILNKTQNVLSREADFADRLREQTKAAKFDRIRKYLGY